MKKLLLASALSAVALGALNAQVINRAIQFSPEGTVDCGAMPDLDNLRSYSLQFWLNPNSWSENANIISRGDNFVVKLGPQNTIRFINGESEVAASHKELKTGEWSQVTLICDDGKAQILVNGMYAGDGSLSGVEKSDASIILGGQYSGLLDEVRIWNDALDDEMDSFDYFIFNTLNKWNPMWDNLIAYYKMDQENCPYLVDYKGIDEKLKPYDNHGIMLQGVEKVEANNDKMPYLINSAYTNNERFFDRIIPREQYLLSNDLIILGVNVYAYDGHLETKSPNNHAISLKNTEYLSEFQGRNGVLSFNGSASMELPASMFPVNDVYTFESWLYIDDWTPGAYLLRKENENQTIGIAVYLGEEDQKRVLVRINGKVYASTLDVSLPVGQWVHFGFCTGLNVDLPNTFYFFKDGRRYNCDDKTDLTTGEKGKANTFINEDSAAFPLLLGENFKGKLDETLLWKQDLPASTVSSHKTKVPMPGLDNTVSATTFQNSLGYYNYDDPEDLGFSSHSQDSWLKIMKSAYEGHAGVKFTISVMGSYTPGAEFGDWRDILGDESKRQRFASDLAEISKNYDGVELDLEWIEKAGQWSDYGLLAKEIREKLPEGKEFRISLHNSYTGFPVDYQDYVDGFTFQQYGPQATNFSYRNFTSNVHNFITKFDRNKIMTSYSTTTSKGANGAAVIGVKGDCLESYVPSEADSDKYTNDAGETWTYMGPMQVYRRAQYTRENNLQGIFYWDMGNDYWLGTAANPEMPVYNQAKYCSYAINANNDTIVTDLSVNHYIPAGVGIINNEISGPVEYYNLQGIKVQRPEKGIYIRKEGSSTRKVIF
ncbi:MAG: hypothetical protein J1F67_02925 [Muribaculaceae bacterium]|nr:hypothetical protein [Muribaculaceae bacterium]